MSKNSGLFWRGRLRLWAGKSPSIAAAWIMLFAVVTGAAHLVGIILGHFQKWILAPPLGKLAQHIPFAPNYFTIVGALVAVLLIIAFNTRLIRLLPFPVWLLNLPVYAVSSLIPKNQRRWVFCARQGLAFAENSKYLFSYVSEHHKEIDAIWITRSKEVYARLTAQGYRCYMAYSPRGYWYSMTAGVVFLSHNKVWDPDGNGFATAGSTLAIQLWHGSPIKRLGRTVEIGGNSALSILAAKLIATLFPFIRRRVSCHRMLASCTTVAKHLAESYGLDESDMLIAGYPKNDGWLRRAQSRVDDGIRRVIYMPTFREVDWKLFVEYEFDLTRLNDFCRERNIEFHIKLHPYSLKRVAPIMKSLEGMSNVKYCDVPDVYEVLDQFDVLVTDYSSISFDYLLYDRPIIFAPFDYDSYSKEERGFLEDYSTLTPGPHARDWLELEALLEAPLLEYKDARQRLNDKFNVYQGNESCEQLVQQTWALIRNGAGKAKPKHYVEF